MCVCVSFFLRIHCHLSLRGYKTLKNPLKLTLGATALGEMVQSSLSLMQTDVHQNRPRPTLNTSFMKMLQNSFAAVTKWNHELGAHRDVTAKALHDLINSSESRCSNHLRWMRKERIGKGDTEAAARKRAHWTMSITDSTMSLPSFLPSTSLAFQRLQLIILKSSSFHVAPSFSVHGLKKS